MSSETTYCRFHEFGCDNKIPAELEGELCQSCDADYRAVAASYERQYCAEKRYTADEVRDAYSDRSEISKAHALLERL
jgi:hypothetical protein